MGDGLGKREGSGDGSREVDLGRRMMGVDR